MSQTREEEGMGYHRPVLVDEVIELIRPVMPGVVIDATFGGGGHSRSMIEEFGDDVEIVGIDRDPQAVANGGALGVRVVEANFSEVGDVAASTAVTPAAILFDFGVSSRYRIAQDRRLQVRTSQIIDLSGLSGPALKGVCATVAAGR